MSDRSPRDVLTALRVLPDADPAAILGLLGYTPVLKPEEKPLEVAVPGERPPQPEADKPTIVRNQVAGAPPRPPGPRLAARARVARRAVTRMPRTSTVAGSLSLIAVGAIIWRLAGLTGLFAILAITVLMAALVALAPYLVAFGHTGLYRTTLRATAPAGHPARQAPAPFVPRPGSSRPLPAAIVAGRRLRGLLPIMLGVGVTEGDIDTGAMLSRLSRGLPVASLPRRVRWSQRHGYTVLVDRGPAMLPYLADVHNLGREVSRLFPGPRRQVLTFSADLLVGVGATLGDLDPLAPAALPARGGRVLVVSDLGVGLAPGQTTATSPQRWLAADRTLRALGTQPLYLCPYPARRLPPALRSLPVLHWRERLTSREVRARLR